MALPLPPADPRRIAYLGTPVDAVGPLQALADAGYDIPVVVTAPDKRRGRGGGTSPSPVKEAALELDLPVAHEVDAVLDAHVDLGVVVAFGQIIRPHVLAEVPMVNLHFSLLPRWRGAAPVERAILAGDPVTGVCVMQMEEGLDTGGTYACRSVAIEEDTTAAELRSRLGEMGTELLLEELEQGEWLVTPQEGEAVYAHKITPDDLRIDWTDSAVHIHRQVRVGGAHTTFRDGRFKILQASVVDEPPAGLGPGMLHGDIVGCGEGALRFAVVQPEGKPRQPAPDWLNGARLEPGERLGG